MNWLGFRDNPAPTINYAGLRTWDNWAYSDDIADYGFLNWSTIHVAGGVFHWDVFDKRRADLISQGKVGVYTFGGVPGWVADQSAAFSSFVTAIVARAAGQGFRIWELWNEPNAGANAISAATAAAFAAIAYPIIKAADPDAVVLSPAPQGNGAGWFGDFLEAGGAAHYDVTALHLYCDTDPDALAAAGGLRAIMANYAAILPDKPIWCSEFSEHGYWFDDLTPANNERDYIGQMLPQLWALGVDRAYWYAWDGDVTGRLWTGAGSNRNVAGDAWNEVRSWMLGARRTSHIEWSGDVGVLNISRTGYSAKIAWHYKGTSDLTIPAGVYTRYRDLAGNVTAIGGAATTAPLTNSAIIIETGAP